MALKNRKQKGSKNERKSIRLLEAEGYRCMKAGASLGIFDIIGIRHDGFVLVQVSSNRWKGLKEVLAIREFKAPTNAIRMLHRWDDYAREPQVRII